MAKYYLYILFSFFILLNGVEYFEKELKQSIKKHSLLSYKIEKQKLYSTHSDEVNSLLLEQKDIFEKDKKLFFKKDKKETIVFSEIQTYLQSISKSIEGEVSHLQSGSVIDLKNYRRYPISLDLRLIPEDLDTFLKSIYLGEKYLFIESIYVVAIERERRLRLKITLVGYQLK